MILGPPVYYHRSFPHKTQRKVSRPELLPKRLCLFHSLFFFFLPSLSFIPQVIAFFPLHSLRLHLIFKGLYYWHPEWLSVKETAADAEKEAEEGVWKGGGAEGHGRCGEQLSADTRISYVQAGILRCSLLLWNLCKHRDLSGMTLQLSRKLAKRQDSQTVSAAQKSREEVLWAWHAPPFPSLSVPFEPGRGL